jgi:hypothetical protein
MDGCMTDIVTEARKRYTQAGEATAANDLLAIADTKFVLGDSDNGWQWEDTILQNSRKQLKYCQSITSQTKRLLRLWRG